MADKDTSNPEIVWVEARQDYDIGRSSDLEASFHEKTGTLRLDDGSMEPGQVHMNPKDAMLLASLIIAYYAEHMEIKP